jgi:hypothetical protein
MFIH